MVQILVSHVLYKSSTITQLRLEQMLYKSFLLLWHIVRRIMTHLKTLFITLAYSVPLTNLSLHPIFKCIQEANMRSSWSYDTFNHGAGLNFSLLVLEGCKMALCMSAKLTPNTSNPEDSIVSSVKVPWNITWILHFLLL